MWIKGDGKVLPGLQRRRNAEADLYGGTTSASTGGSLPSRKLPQIQIMSNALL